ncbi:MAG TPA: hypothetical protein VMH82_15295 [Myxococcota bacterium]|nr:hypothetical protein [Myxococcota bacterium]
MASPGSWRRFAALFPAFAAAALVVYGPALHGSFVSDDVGYVLGNPWIHELSAENLWAILDPTGPAAKHTINYAPVHLLLHALDWQAFGADVLGHHVVNVVLHALTSVLVAALFARSGLSFRASAVGGALFLLHPANVEAVAWIFQLKTIAALALACGALLAEPRRPALATILFGLALLAKIQAAFALPVAAVWLWLGHPASPQTRGARLGWLAAWALLLALTWLPEFGAFERGGHVELSGAAGPVERLRALFSLVGRYLVMAASAYGTSTFHQPDAPRSWADPWCALGLVGTAVLGALAVLAFRRRSEDAAWWTWTAGGFLPVSQLLGFLYPMADRYLYFILPGLIGGSALVLRAALARVVPPGAQPALRRAAAVLAIAVLAACAWRSSVRADVWRSEITLMIDAAAHYPDGMQANLLRAQSAARRGDADTVAASLRAASAHGFDRFMDLDRDPAFASVRDDPAFRAAVRDIAGRWIAAVEPRSDPTSLELLVLGQAHATRGEWELAARSLERAVASGGPGSDEASSELAEVRAKMATEQAGQGEDGAPPGASGGGARGEATP